MRSSGASKASRDAGDDSAVRAGRFVRAYSARQHSQYAVAEAELKGIDFDSIHSDSERYRVLTLQRSRAAHSGQGRGGAALLGAGVGSCEQDAR